MEKLSTTLYSYRINKIKPSIAIVRLSSKEEDLLIEHYSDIIHPDYRKWFIKRLRALGKQRFIQMGDMARKYGNNKERYFASLVR